MARTAKDSTKVDLSAIAKKYPAGSSASSAAPAVTSGNGIGGRIVGAAEELLGKDFGQGLRESSAGLALTGQLPPAPPPNQDAIDILQQGAGTLLGDLPLSIIGGILGAAGGTAAAGVAGQRDRKSVV